MPYLSLTKRFVNAISIKKTKKMKNYLTLLTKSAKNQNDTVPW